MKHIQDFIRNSDKRAKINNDIVSFNEVVVGLIHPCAQYRELQGNTWVMGPKGVIAINNLSIMPLLGSLAACGALLLGDELLIANIKTILANPRQSRTAAYLLCLNPDLKQLPISLQKLEQSTVVIVGCGGIGALSAFLLAGAGVGKLILVDPDIIEESNLNRQMFWTQRDQGKFKVDILVFALYERFNKSVQVLGIQEELSTNELNSEMREASLAIISADNPLGIHLKIANTFAKNGIPVVGGGYNNTNSIHFEQSLFIDCEKEPSVWEACAQKSIAPSYGPVNAEVAGLLCNRAIQILICFGEPLQKNKFYYANSYDFPRKYYA